MAVFASDSFTNTNGTLLVTHNSNWVYNNAWEDVFRPSINNNELVGNAAQVDPIVSVYSEASTSDYEVAATIKQLSTNTTANAGIVARMRSDQATGYMARYRYNTGVQLFVFDNSITGTQLGSTVSGNLSNGNTMRLRLRCEGDQISVYKNDTLVIGPITNTAVSAANSPGIWVFGSSSVGCSIDNWEAVSLDAPPASSIAVISNYYRMMRSA